MRLYLAILLCSFFAAVLSDTAVPGTSPAPKSVNNNVIRCPDFCTELYNPFCARNKRCTVAFGNPCKLDQYNCKNSRKGPFVQVDAKFCNNFSTPNFFYCRR